MTNSSKHLQTQDLNPDAVNAPFPTRDQKAVLAARREELLDLLEGADDQSWRNNPGDELRRMLRVTTSEERNVSSQLKASSAIMRRDFDLSMD